MTDEQLAAIREWLEQASEPCGNDACIGEWAAVHGRALLDEVERLRADAELGRLVRGELYGLWINSGKIATLAVMDGNWFCSTEDDLGPGYDTPEDALRAAVAEAQA